MQVAKDRGWLPKRSCSRKKSIDTKSAKSIVIKEEVPTRMETRQRVKVLNKFKNGFD